MGLGDWTLFDAGAVVWQAPNQTDPTGQIHVSFSDGAFVGFPSYWNIVAFYLYVLALPGWFALLTIIVLALLTFVPSLYLYTTHGGRFSTFTNLFGTVWALAGIVLLVQWRAAPPWLAWASLSFPVYYFVCSWLITIRFWAERRESRKLISDS